MTGKHNVSIPGASCPTFSFQPVLGIAAIAAFEFSFWLGAKLLPPPVPPALLCGSPLLSPTGATTITILQEPPLRMADVPSGEPRSAI